MTGPADRSSTTAFLVLLVLVLLGLPLLVLPSVRGNPTLADLELSVAGTPATGGNGGLNEIEWQVTLRNSTAGGAGATATAITVQDVVSADPLPTTLRRNASTTSGSYDVVTGTWQVPALGPGAEAVLTFRTLFTGSIGASTGTLSAQVTAQAPDDLDSRPSENAFVGDQDDESVFRTGAGQRVAVGDLVWNDLNGDGRFSAGEPGVRGVPVIVSSGTTTLYSNQTDENGRWRYPSLLSGTSITVRFVAPPGVAFSAAKVGGDDAFDSDPAVSTGVTTARTVTAEDLRLDAGLLFPADVSLTKAVSPGSGTAPLLASYVVVLSNAGPHPAAGLVVTDALPAGTSPLATPTVTQGAASVSNGQITWTIGQVGPGSSATLRYELRHTATGAAMNRAQVTSMGTYDPDSIADGAATACKAAEDDCATTTVSVTAPPAAAPGTVAGTVWLDANGDGQRQAAEPTRSGVAVRLRSSAEALLASTTTDASGRYAFPGLAAGSYVVEVVHPVGAVFAVQDVGPDATDSDVGTSTGRAAATAQSGVTTTVDAGLVRADAPTSDAVVVAQGATVTFDVLDNDAVPGRARGGALPTGWTWSRLDGPAWGSASCTATGSCTLTSVADYAGADGFRYTLTNPTFGAATVSVAISVLPVNDAPVARDDRAVTTPGAAVTLPVLENDEDPNHPADPADPNRPGDPLRVTATGPVEPTGAGAVSCSADTCTFTPAAGFSGAARFGYTVSDNGAPQPRTATATVTVWVDPNPAAAGGFTGGASATAAAGVGRWQQSTTVTASPACVSGRPRVTIAWAAADRAASYRVERQAVAGPGSDRWTTIATTAATTHDDSLVGEARGFRYRATPLRGRWIGTPSPSVEVTTPVAASFSGC